MQQVKLVVADRQPHQVAALLIADEASRLAAHPRHLRRPAEQQARHRGLHRNMRRLRLLDQRQQLRPPRLKQLEHRVGAFRAGMRIEDHGEDPILAGPHQSRVLVLLCAERGVTAANPDGDPTRRVDARPVEARVDTAAPDELLHRRLLPLSPP
ncbi:hypothetical protein ASC68_12450 [Devosia sp. Root105]|nr:hypothetical protein ASC68_12450 [Devosia sp. Root105]